MSIRPIDLQVVLSKATEVSQSLSKSDSNIHAAQMMGNESIHQKSQQVTETVNNLEQKADEFSKINEDQKGEKEKHENEKKKKNGQDDTNKKEYKKAILKEGMGKYIDIVD